MAGSLGHYLTGSQTRPVAASLATRVPPVRLQSRQAPTVGNPPPPYTPPPTAAGDRPVGDPGEIGPPAGLFGPGPNGGVIPPAYPPGTIANALLHFLTLGR